MTATAEPDIMPPPPDWALIEKEETYHHLSKIGECLSSGMLKTFRECPAAYRRIVSGEEEPKDTAAYRFGRAAHKIILEGYDAFAKTYALGGPVNPKTGKCYGPDTKAFADWLVENNLDRDRVVTIEENDVLTDILYAVQGHAVASQYLAFGWPELVARADLHGEPCQIRMDWLTRDAAGNHAIVDLKTTDNITWFEADAKRYGYLHQFAFYRDVLRAASGKLAQVAAIVVEKKAPFRAGVWTFAPDILDFYSAENALAIRDYTKCKQTGTWPTGYEEAREFSPARA